MNIYVVVEIKKREFIPKLLLSLEAALNNHVVYLGNINQLIKKNYLKPGLLHHKSITPVSSKLSLLKKLKKNRFIVSSLDEEVGGVSVNAQEYVKIRYGNNTFKFADIIFTWGKFDYYNLTKTYKKFKDKIINSGNPRVDLWRDDFQKYYGKRKKKFILISSNYNFLFGHHKLIEQYNRKKNLDYFKRGESEKFYFHRIKKEAVLIEKLVMALKNLSTKFKSKKFLFRPHPEEDIEAWKSIFEDCKNIKVNNSGNLSDVMNNAEIVLHNGCTGGLESAIRKIPTISYMPFNDMSAGHPVANKVSRIVRTEKQLIRIFERIFENKKKYFPTQVAKNEINSRYENLENTPAYKKIVKTWNRFDNDQLRLANNDFLLKKFYLNKKLKKKLTFKPYKDYKFDPFTKKEINEVKNKLIKIDSRFKKVYVKIVGDDLLKISLNKL